MNKQVSSERWQIAQKSEKEYWSGFNQEILVKNEIIRHKEKAKILEKEWERWVNINKNTRILQIGCGPEDVIDYFSTGKLYAVDPLAEFYKKKFNLNYKKITFLEARGESLPFKDNYFDVVILANVLDHVENIGRVLSEAKRVLKKDGTFHFENLFYQKGFIQLAKIWGPIKKTLTGEIFNVHHPFMFTKENLKKILSSNFKIIHEETGRDIGIYENMQDLINKKKRNRNINIRLPAKFGLYGIINYTAICKKSSF
jgi:ubiquinone/menaquinone biosynthesis C-methylase UbiE